MPLFICDCCGSLDNTACGGSFWHTKWIELEGEKKEHEIPDLCCKCYTGEWHNKFPYMTCTANVFFEQGESNFVYWMVNDDQRPGIIGQRQRKKYQHKKANRPRSKNHMKKLASGQKKRK